MGLPVLKWIIAALFALTLTITTRQLLGWRGRQDPMLLGGTIVTAGFVLGGVLGLVLAERGALALLCFGLLGVVRMTRRWQSHAAASTSSPGA